MNTTTLKNEQSVTHIWTRFNLKWIITGAVSGILAGLFVIGIGSLIAGKHLGEWSQPFKIIGAAIYGKEALHYGSFGRPGLMGLFIHMLLSAIYGGTFAQMVNEKSSRSSLVILGLVTSLVIWVFGCALFMPSFDIFLRISMPITLGVILHIIFGISFGLILSLVRPVLLKK